MSYDIHILVNGSRCKQYHHNGRTFIEAKEGSEYVIEVKNNTWKRIMACVSVDGLNILNGEAATIDGPGYIINSYCSNRYEGFRVSNDTVAKFVFGKKGQSYAASKEDGSERNVGVIGLRLYEEKYRPPIVVETTRRFYKNYTKGGTADPMPPEPTIWCDTSTASWGSDALDLTLKDYEPERSFGGGQSALRGMSTGMACSVSPQNLTEAFDMGTTWGGAKESRVIEVEFERGYLTLSTDIYYASRQSLIEMGVPVTNEKQVTFPSSFNDKYAKPPKGWRG